MSIGARIARFAAPWVRELEPHGATREDGLVRLDAVEIPYPLPAQLRPAWLEAVAAVEINRYPDPQARALRDRLLALHQLAAPTDVLLGNGSDELVRMLCLAFARGPGACMLTVEPSFALFRLAARAVGMRAVSVPLRAGDFALDLAATLAAIEAAQPALVFLASPNNPTANRLDVDNLEALCATAPGLVVLDEAYYRFAGATRVAEVARYENLVVLHTLSKVGLAGLRVGALYGAAEWLALIERLRMPYNISALSQAGALFALEHAAAFTRQVEAVLAARAELAARLTRLPGVRVWPSATNFLLVGLPRGRGPASCAALREAGVLVRDLDGTHPLLADCLRIGIGTADDNRLLVDALGAILAD
ncbi:MAG: histidinol-phosphate transaminase [Gammaproteobacteria bacterium]